MADAADVLSAEADDHFHDECGVFGILGRQEAAATLPAARTGDALATLTLAPGVRIVSAQTGNGRLVLHLTGPTGDEVQVIDLSSGQLSQQIKTAPAP